MKIWEPRLRERYIIEGTLYQEALDYARDSRSYTSDRHDFHPGGLDNKQQKMPVSYTHLLAPPLIRRVQLRGIRWTRSSTVSSPASREPTIATCMAVFTSVNLILVEIVAHFRPKGNG